MKTHKDYLDAWAEHPPLPREAGTVRAVGRRLGEGRHERLEVVEVDVTRGVEGDRWFTDSPDKFDRQVAVMAWPVAVLCAGEAEVHRAGDNFFVDLDLSEDHLPPGARLAVGESVVLEVTDKPHLGCERFESRFGKSARDFVNDDRLREQRLRGLYARVITGGEVRVGDRVFVA